MKISIDERGKVRELEVEGRSATVGRDPRNAVVLESDAISAFHLELRVTPKGLAARDLGSRNGSAVVREGQSEEIPVQAQEFVIVGPADTLLLGARDVPVRLHVRVGEAVPKHGLNETIHAFKPVMEASVERVDREAWPVLLQLNKTLLESTSVDEVLSSGLEGLLDLFSTADGASVVLFGEEPHRVVKRLRDRDVLLDRPHVPLDEAPERRVMTHRVVTDRVGLVWTEGHSGASFRSIAAAPLWVGETVLGAVFVEAECPPATPLRASELDRLLVPASALALALRNAQHVEEISAARERLADENERLREDLSKKHDGPTLIGESEPMRRLRELVVRIGPTPLSVLVTGETGTGKELVARLLHHDSDRSARRFVACNVASLPSSLVEAELFGVARGAYKGATEDRPGLFEAADGGTLFLDEIGELTSEVQATLLRVLQENELRRVGETRTRKIDVRLVAATNRDLSADVRDGRFRQDLFFRINTVTLDVPPLRDRREDMSLLVAHLLKVASLRLGRPVPAITEEALEILQAYSWPGNVRQLGNELARAVALTPTEESMRADVLSAEIRGVPAEIETSRSMTCDRPLKEALAAYEREYVRSVLLTCEGNRTRAAKALGITRPGIHKIIRRHGIED